MVLRAGAITAVLIVLAGCSKKEPEIQGGLQIVYPLGQLTNEAELIAEGSLVRFDAQSRKAVLRLGDAIQGRIATPEVELNCAVGLPIASESLRRHLVPGLPIVWFSNNACALVYINRFFIMCYASGDPAAGKWEFTYVETLANGTYN